MASMVPTTSFVTSNKSVRYGVSGVNGSAANISRHNGDLVKCSNFFPRIEEYFPDLLESPVELVFACLCAVTCLCTFAVFVKEVFSDNYKYKEPGKRLGILVVLGIYPMTSFMACFAVLIPRTTFLADLIASCYLSLCLYVFIRILIQYYGNTEFMIKRLEPGTIALRSPPCCCCCCCLPAIHVTTRSVYVIKSLILQAAILQPLFNFLQAGLWANDNNIIHEKGWHSPLIYLNLVNVCSILFAMYGLTLLVRASLDILSSHRIRRKLLLIQSVLIFTNLQKAVFQSVLVRFGIPACHGTWDSGFRASMIHHMLLVFEMGAIAVLAGHVYRKSDDRNISATIVNRKIIYDTVATSTNDIDRLFKEDNGCVHVSSA